jgi:hypothetical protein
MQLTDDLGFWLRETIYQQGLQLRGMWRPDSWDRFVESLSDESLRSALIPNLLIRT